MAMKIGSILVRKEADIYRSQGLHKEAREVYAKFLAGSTAMDPLTQDAIEKQMQQIELEIGCGNTEEAQQLSVDQIDIIKKGWSASATEADFLVCARVFMQIGRHADALIEFGNMILRGSAFESLSPSITDCFVQLFEPETLPFQVGRYANALFSDDDRRLDFQIAIAEQLFHRGQTDHAVAFYRQLRQSRTGSLGTEARLATLGKRISALSPLAASSDADPAQGSGPQHRFGFERIGGTFRWIICKIANLNGARSGKSGFAGLKTNLIDKGGR